MEMLGAVSVLSSATIEAVSVFWMEAVMFIAASLIYTLVFTRPGFPMVGGRAKMTSGKYGSKHGDISTCSISSRSACSGRPARGGQVGRGAAVMLRHLEQTAVLDKPVAANTSASKADLQHFAAMIKARAGERDGNGAKAIFEKLRLSGTSMTPLIYNCLLDALVQCEDMVGALAHFEEMKRLGFVDVVGFNTLLKAHLKRGETKEGHALVQEMAVRGLHANAVTYNQLLHAKVLAKDHKGILSVIDNMHAAGLRATSIFCSILLKSLTAESGDADIKYFMSLVDEIEEPIDEVLFASVIEVCNRIRNPDVLSKFMRRYSPQGTCVKLASAAYGSMIKAYGLTGEIARVHELWAEMEGHGVKPTSITFGCMVESLVANGQADEAWQLVQKRLGHDSECINTVICSTVIKGFVVARRMDMVREVYKEMRDKGILCNTVTYNTMLDGYAKCHAMDRASELLADMKESAEPDVITYSTIIKGFCLAGDVDRALQIHDDMKGEGRHAPDEIMYNSLLDGCAKKHRTKDALHILDEMKAAGVAPSNYTLSILVKVLGHAKRLGQAFSMVEELSKQNGFRPNIQVYTCLMQACFLNKSLNKAFEIHDTMIANPECKMDEKLYSALAKGCLQMHQPLKAVEVVRAAYQLPCHSLSKPAQQGRPIGVDMWTLGEIAVKLQAGTPDEQDAFVALSADLAKHRGVQINGAGSVHCGTKVRHGMDNGRSVSRLSSAAIAVVAAAPQGGGNRHERPCRS